MAAAMAVMASLVVKGSRAASVKLAQQASLVLLVAMHLPQAGTRQMGPMRQTVAMAPTVRTAMPAALPLTAVMDPWESRAQRVAQLVPA